MADNVKEFNRIVYVEPNDFEKINGEPLTPDYTDYTIYCNLIVERVSRLKHGNGGKNQSGDASIMYDLNDGKQGWVSFFKEKVRNIIIYQLVILTYILTVLKNIT